MKWQITLTLSLVAVMFSGCAEDIPTQGTLTRTLIGSISEETDSFTSTFTYIHDGDEAAVADITVEYQDGAFAKNKPLSQFTQLQTLQVGDTVQITGLPAFTEVQLEGNGVLATREADDADWLLAEGTPLPLHGEGSAQWAWDAEMGIAFSWDQFQFTEEFVGGYETTTLEDVNFDIGYDFTGDLAIDSGRNLHMSFALDGDIEGNGGATVELYHFEYESEYNYTDVQSASFDADLELDAELDVSFKVEDNKLLQATTEGFGEIDGSASFTYQDNAMDLTAFLPMRESFGPITEDIQRRSLDPEFANLMEFYGSTLQVGDGMELSFEFEDMEVRYDLLASREETITTAAGDVDAIFLAGTLTMDAAVWEFGPIDFGSWITETGLPVKSSWSGDFDFPLEELLGLAEDFDESFTAPSNLAYEANFDVSMELSSLSGDIRSAPWMFVAGPIGFYTQLEY